MNTESATAAFAAQLALIEAWERGYIAGINEPIVPNPKNPYKQDSEAT